MPALGILGGSFDPVHLAHLLVAERAREALALDRVLLVPAARQPLKAEGPAASPDDRLVMLRLATAGNPALEVDPLELARGGPSYTADTLDELRRRWPAAELYLILGSDAYQQLDRWRRASDVRGAARIVVVPRPGPARTRPGEPAAYVDERAPGGGAPLALDLPSLGISASDIRARVARGASIRYLVPEAVRAYILERGLYRSAGSPSGP